MWVWVGVGMGVCGGGYGCVCTCMCGCVCTFGASLDPYVLLTSRQYRVPGMELMLL